MSTIAVLACVCLFGPAAAQAVSPGQCRCSHRLPDRLLRPRRRPRVGEGFQDGRFCGQGWHITGEMGGILTPPLKLLDGV